MKALGNPHDKEQILRRLATIQPGTQVFGQMSETPWMRLAYMHANHHLQQFGA